MAQIDIHELFYRNIKMSHIDTIEGDRKIEEPKKNNAPDSNTGASTKETISAILDEFNFVKAQPFQEGISKLGDFNICRLPLIDVAKYLKIVVLKSINPSLAEYNPEYRIIYIGSNRTKKTFLHELAHAVDDILSFRSNRECFRELVAELSAVVLCRTYSIPFIISYSKYYFEEHYACDINSSEIINRVIEIVDFIKRCKSAIERNKTVDHLLQAEVG